MLVLYKLMRVLESSYSPSASPHALLRQTLASVQLSNCACALHLSAGVQLIKVGVTATLLVAATRLSSGGPLMPLRNYLWAAGGAFVTWRIASTTLRRLVGLFRPDLHDRLFASAVIVVCYIRF